MSLGTIEWGVSLFLATLLHPVFCLALEPQNPEAYCDRLLTQQEIQTCQKKMKTLDLDWYAAGVCNLLESDQQFEKCIQKISGRSFAPKSIEACEGPQLDDLARESCLFSGRAPSSVGTSTPYQDLKTKKRVGHAK